MPSVAGLPINSISVPVLHVLVTYNLSSCYHHPPPTSLPTATLPLTSPSHPHHLPLSHPLVYRSGLPLLGGRTGVVSCCQLDKRLSPGVLHELAHSHTVARLPDVPTQPCFLALSSVFGLKHEWSSSQSVTSPPFP